MNAYVGTKNVVKLNAVKEVLNPLGYTVLGFDVESKVSNQPKTDEETILGAKNRALALPKDGLRIGLEAGVAMLDDTLYLTNFGVMIDLDDNIYKAGGTRIPLPNVIKDLIINDNLELSEAMNLYFKTVDIKHKNGAIGYFTSDLVKRVDIFTHIVKLLYGQYLYKRKELQK